MEKLTIKNFGCLKYVDIEVKDLTVFTGAQASGKSLTAEVLKFMRDMTKLVRGQEFLDTYKDQLRHRFGYIVEQSADFSFEYLNGDIKISMIKDGTYYEEILRTHDLPEETKSRTLFRQALQNKLLKGTKPSTYCSSGQRKVFDLIRALHREDSDGLLVLEEPETNLYPEAQADIMKYIASSVNKRNRILITTHSPYMLATANNLLKAGQMEDKEKTQAVIPEEAWLAPGSVSAYHFKDGEVRDLMTDKDGFIDDSAIDGVSSDICAVFSKLLAIQYPDC